MKNSNISQEFIKEREDKMFTTLNSKLKRMLSVILALSMVLSPIMALAEEVGEAVATATDDPLAVVYAASDFQPRRQSGTDSSGNPKYGDYSIYHGMQQMTSIITQIKKKYNSSNNNAVTGALIGGDVSNYSKYNSNWDGYAYNNDPAMTEDGAYAIENVLCEGFGLSREEIVMIQGNHDFYVAPFDNTGAHDTEQYGVYAINEKDFMYRQNLSANGEDTIKKTAADLDAYLQAKVAQHYNKPIFILGHVPLHHNIRTEDNIHSRYIFNVVNKAAGQGLTIFFLFGHNHGSGYDAHLGEGAIYLPIGDTICIPTGKSSTVSVNSTTTTTTYGFTQEKLNFVYMNYGYVGYINSGKTSVDTTLTSTVFAIYKDRVEVERYDGDDDDDGFHDLKTPGKLIPDNGSWYFSKQNLVVNTKRVKTNTVRLDNKFNVSLDISELYPPKTISSPMLTGANFPDGIDANEGFRTTGGNAVTGVETTNKSVTIKDAEGFKVGTTGTLKLDCMTEQFVVKDVVSSDPSVATLTVNKDGTITVKGEKAGKTTITVVAKHAGGTYADVALSYDLVVFPTTTQPIYFTKYKLLNAGKKPNTGAAETYYSSYKYADNLETGKTYVIVSEYENPKNWAYALLGSKDSDATSTRTVTVYGTPTVHTPDKIWIGGADGSFVDSCDPYMEWSYASIDTGKRDGGWFRNNVTGETLIAQSNGVVVTKSNYSPDAYARLFMAGYGLDFRDANGDSLGPYKQNSDGSQSATNCNRRYLRFSGSLFSVEKNTKDENQRYSSKTFIYEKIEDTAAPTGENAWVDGLVNNNISAFVGDVAGITSATIYVSDGINVKEVPVTLNMLHSETDGVTLHKNTAAGTISGGTFKIVYDGATLASGLTLTLVAKPTLTCEDATIKIGETYTGASIEEIEDATFKYESSNYMVASADATGAFVGTNVGGTRVTVTYEVDVNGTKLPVSEDAYVTVLPKDTCSKNVRPFSTKSAFVLHTKTYLHEDNDTFFASSDHFMIVSENKEGMAYALSLTDEKVNGVGAVEVAVESNNGKLFIDTDPLYETTFALTKNGAADTPNSYFGLRTSNINGGDKKNTYINAVRSWINTAYQNQDLTFDSSLVATYDSQHFSVEYRNSILPAGKHTVVADTTSTSWGYNNNKGGFITGYNRNRHFLIYDDARNQFSAKYLGTGDDNAVKWQNSSVNPYLKDRVYVYTQETVEMPGVIIWLSDGKGAVDYNAAGSARTGTMINVTTHTPDGVVTKSYPMTVDTLSDNTAKNFTTAVTSETTYEDLTVKYTYNGKEYTVCTKYDLTVKEPANIDYPDYPDQGSVNTTKTLDSSKYNHKETGISHIDLTVSGVPLSNGSDIVIVLDLSTSMDAAVHKCGSTSKLFDSSVCSKKGCKMRIQLLMETLTEFLNTLRTPNKNGIVPDIDISIASFNGQTLMDKTHLLSPLIPSVSGKSVIYAHYNLQDVSKIHFPFVGVTDSAVTTFLNGIAKDINTLKGKYPTTDAQSSTITESLSTLALSEGTNYDRAMELAYDLLYEKKTQNIQRGENRTQTVLFMSDGASYQYNYFGTYRTNGDLPGNNHYNTGYASNNKYVWKDKNGYSKWSYYITGKLDEVSGTFSNKNTAWHDNFKTNLTSVTVQPVGESSKTYTISGKKDPQGIVSDNLWSLFNKYYNRDGKQWTAEAIKGDPTKLYKIIDPDSAAADHIENVYGLGATIYSVAFALAPEAGMSIDVLNDIVKGISSGDGKFFASSDEQGLIDAFSNIVNDVKTSGDAVYEDQLGDDFKLKMDRYYTVDRETFELDNPTSITLTSYPLYKYWEVGTVIDGVKVTENMVGKRKTANGTPVETITFSKDGKQAFSSLINNSKTNILGSDYIIRGMNVWYNTSTEAVTLTDADKSKLPKTYEKYTTIPPETFFWLVGDIPEDEYVLGYDVYLDGAMEGQALGGMHSTNNYAKLTYTNYLGKECHLDPASPRVAWNEAYVGVGFYFVNDDGQPLVNRKTGQTGSFEAAQKLSDITYYNFKLNEGELIDRKIIASQQLPGGYVLYDEAAAYEVFAASSSTLPQHWKITKGDVPVATTYVTQIGSAATSSNKLEENGKEYTYMNTIVYFAIYGNVDAVDDTVVVDYGLNVFIDVMANDILFMGEANLVAVSPDPAPTGLNDTEEDRGTPNAAYIKSDGKNPKRGVNTKYGAANITSTDNPSIPKDEIRYTVKGKDHGGVSANKSMQFDQKDVFSYAAKYTGDSAVQGYYYANVTVIPATTVYYEETFVTFKVYELEQDANYNMTRKAVASSGVAAKESDSKDHTSWYYVGSASSYTQAQDRPGKMTQNDINNIYGYDGAYAATTSAKYSSGRAVVFKAKADSTLKDRAGRPVGKYEGEISFTFYGTGFDLISASSSSSGTVIARVYPLDANGKEIASGMKAKMVDTFYGYTYEDGEWKVTTTSDDKNAIYQIPVLKFQDLEYGRYKVYLTVSYSELFKHNSGSNYNFFFDAVRIYDPVNNGANDDVIRDVYIQDNECWPVYKEVRDLLISADSFNILGHSSVSGSVFIDDWLTTDSNGLVTKEYSISDYNNYGPNNEVYLIKGQAIAFDLNAENASAVHIAVKAMTSDLNDADGNNVGISLKIYNAQFVNGKVEIKNEKVINNITSSTDLYYDISKLKGGTVVIENITTATETSKKPAILSITNLKFTYLSEEARNADNAQLVATVSQQTGKVAVAAMRMMATPWLDVETEETNVFVPEQFDVSVSKSTVRQGSTVTVTVNTSADVDRITVNGVEITKYTKAWFTSGRAWKYTVRADEAGDTPIIVVAYNADGAMSDELINAINVTERVNLVSTSNGGMLDRMYAGWSEKLSAKAN